MTYQIVSRPRTAISAIYLLILAMLSACDQKIVLAEILVSERQGLDRALEYVKVRLPVAKQLDGSEQLFLVEKNSRNLIPAQIRDYDEDQGVLYARVIFPVAIDAGQHKAFEAYIAPKKEVNAPFPLDKAYYLEYQEEEGIVQNSFYSVRLSNSEEGPGGQIEELILKKNQGQVLKRGHLSMHFAPNFSRPDMQDYSSIESLGPFSENHIEKGEYYVSTKREGNIRNFQEIRVAGTYEFYKGLPYFIFSSTISIEKDVELGLLRNDEMTMDSLFTHLMYKQNAEARIRHVDLYSDELDALEKNPIADNAPWLSFYHKEKEYAFGCIRLQYDNANERGTLSTVDRPIPKLAREVMVEDTGIGY